MDSVKTWYQNTLFETCKDRNKPGLDGIVDGRQHDGDQVCMTELLACLLSLKLRTLDKNDAHSLHDKNIDINKKFD